MRGSLRLGRIAGIEIGIHYSWMLIFILFSTSLSLAFFPQASPNKAPQAYWMGGILVTLMLFVSVLVHELAHSLVAQAKGIPVRSITLFIFGGVSNLEEESKRPGIEFVMAIAGPATSLMLAIVFWILFQALQPGPFFNGLFRFDGRLPQPTIVGAGLLYLALINISLAAFNILPGFPLDGGRVLRSIVWGATGNLVRATNVAATIGRLFGWSFIAIGVLNILGFQVLIFGPGLGGLWIGFIGWFLSNAAESNRQDVTLREQLGGASVKDAMVQYQASIGPTAPVDELVRGILSQRFGRAVPVCDEERTIGIVTIGDVKGVPQEKWPTTPVEQVMTRAPLYSVTPEDSLSTAMKLIAQHDLNQVIVIKDGRCSGLLSRAEIIRYLQLAQELRGKGKIGK
jgi:Zn-dependent protease/CBS domain-containing protein